MDLLRRFDETVALEQRRALRVGLLRHIVEAFALLGGGQRACAIHLRHFRREGLQCLGEFVRLVFDRHDFIFGACLIRRFFEEAVPALVLVRRPHYRRIDRLHLQRYLQRLAAE